MSRSHRRKLVQVLLTEGGAQIVEFNSPSAYDELVLETTPLWRRRPVRVRVATRSIEQRDVDRLVERVTEHGNAEGLLIAPLDPAIPALEIPVSVSAIGALELAERMERSALIAWPNRKPVPAYDRVTTHRHLERGAAFLDPVGLRWLPVVAFNELPLDLAKEHLLPQDALERLAFRLMTSVFRFGGKRYGESMPGKGLPDALLTFAESSKNLVGALLDCKAAADGYRMDSDHLLRFQRYVSEMRPELEERGVDVRYVVVLSSEFQGTAGARHPFHNRASSLRKSHDVQLVYLRAVDLARLAVTVQGVELSPAARERLDWASCFENGRVSSGDLDAMLEAVA